MKTIVSLLILLSLLAACGGAGGKNFKDMSETEILDLAGFYQEAGASDVIIAFPITGAVTALNSPNRVGLQAVSWNGTTVKDEGDLFLNGNRIEKRGNTFTIHEMRDGSAKSSRNFAKLENDSELARRNGLNLVMADLIVIAAKFSEKRLELGTWQIIETNPDKPARTLNFSEPQKALLRTIAKNAGDVADYLATAYKKPLPLYYSTQVSDALKVYPDFGMILGPGATETPEAFLTKIRAKDLTLGR